MSTSKYVIPYYHNNIQLPNMTERTESKATTVWGVSELTKDLPKLMHSGLRSSRYYTRRNDSITIQAQTQRSRAANTDDNHEKLAEEIQRIYRDTIPAMTSDKKVKKYEAL
jgi:peptidyl-tRNA hydrolase ICT1